MREEKLFVGRQTELQALKQGLEPGAAKQLCHLLSGEAGSSKTALLNAFGRIAQENTRIW